MSESLEERSVGELLSSYAKTLAELRRREIVRTNNAPVGDYAEWLVARAMDGSLVKNSAKSFDVDSAQGRVQVKARVVSHPPTRGQLQSSPFRSWAFEFAALVLIRADDYVVHRAALVPVDAVRAASTFRKHINGSIVFMTDQLFGVPGSTDMTDDLRAAASLA